MFWEILGAAVATGISGIIEHDDDTGELSVANEFSLDRALTNFEKLHQSEMNKLDTRLKKMPSSEDVYQYFLTTEDGSDEERIAKAELERRGYF